MDSIDEVLTRGVTDVVVRENLERRLRAGEKLRVKLGIDPTGSQLHIGRAVPLLKLRQFQRLGHTICLLIGDFTGQIGDASDKSAARRMLSADEVQSNMVRYREQIGRILDLDAVEFSHNSVWLSKLVFKDVVLLASNFTVAQMLERENFSLRYAEGKPIGLHEFFYPLMQGYDSVALRTDLEIGGTDQLFNLMAGRPIQRMHGQPPQDIMTLNMIWGLDGRKMSTSDGNTILIEEPPIDMYGKIMSMSDQHLVPYFEVATEVPMDEVAEISRELAAGCNPINIKKKLAYEVTRLYHGDAGAQAGQRIFEELHQAKGDLSDDDWPEVSVTGAWPRKASALFVEAGLAASNGEARRIIQQGGLEIEGAKVVDAGASVIPVSGMRLRRGKNKLARLRVV
jgi:tyrosyl-tRNA synthetase